MWLPDRWPCIHSLKTTFFQTNRPSKETVALSVLSQLSWCIRARETYDCMHNKFFLTPQLQTSDVQPNSSIIAEAPSSRSLPGKLLRGRWGLRVPLLTHYVMCQLPSLLLFRAHTVLHGGFFLVPQFLSTAWLLVRSHYWAKGMWGSHTPLHASTEQRSSVGSCCSRRMDGRDRCPALPQWSGSTQLANKLLFSSLAVCARLCPHQHNVEKSRKCVGWKECIPRVNSRPAAFR